MAGSGIQGLELSHQGLYADVAGTNTISASDVTQVIRHRRSYKSILADATAATETAETALFYCDVAISIIAINLIPGAGLTSSDSDYKTLTINKWTSAGASKTAIAVWATTTTGTGDWTAMVKVSPSTALNAATSLAAGVGISYITAKSGNGVAIPGFCLEIVYTED